MSVLQPSDIVDVGIEKEIKRRDFYALAAVVESDLYENLDAESFALTVKTPEEALEAGIGFEKDAILFFGGLANFVDPKAREVIQELISEEQQHMLQLFEMKKKLQA